MKIDEQIPEELFDWVKSMPYDALSEIQRETVLRWFTPAEYDDMHRALYLVSENRLSRKDALRTNLLTVFDKKYQSRTVELRLAVLRVWQVAAAILFVMLFGSSYLWIRAGKKTPVAEIIQLRDTVYMEAPQAEVIRVHDTVFLQHQQGSRITHKQDHSVSHPRSLPQVSDVHIRSIHEVDALPNRVKNNSIKDDTLISHYSFVTL